MHYKIRYVGRGHLLSNEQFDYLITKDIIWYECKISLKKIS
jgi:hypothetical protein